MNFKTLTLVILVIVAISFGGLLIINEVKNLFPTSTPIPTPSPIPTPITADNTGATKEGITNIVSANNKFALDFYSDLKQKEEGNIFFSPYSISTALSMVYEGARGQTAKEIQSVFYLPEDSGLRRPAIAAIYNQLNEKDAKYKLNTANALWAQKDYQLLQDYLDAVAKYYAGKAANVDFAGATEEARKIINTWVEEQTNNKIKDLFPQGSLNPLTRLVLTNAIYFKGNWVKQFDKNQTKDEDFKISPEETIKTPMMSRTDEKSIFGYAETKDLQILEMPYEGQELSMLVLLPKNNDLNSLEKLLTAEKIEQWKKEIKEQRVNVYMPKFTFNTKYTLNENLAKMGMPSAFLPGQADFSGINGNKELFIHMVVHRAFVDVNEEGTEAAAATGVSVGITSVGPIVPTFRADHPFIFLIQEKETGNILFIGRVADPSK